MRWTEGLWWCPAGFEVRPSKVGLDSDLETFPRRAATSSVSTSLVIVYDVMADWWSGQDEDQNGRLKLYNDEDHILGFETMWPYFCCTYCPLAGIPRILPPINLKKSFTLNSLYNGRWIYLFNIFTWFSLTYENRNCFFSQWLLNALWANALKGVFCSWKHLNTSRRKLFLRTHVWLIMQISQQPVQIPYLWNKGRNMLQVKF